MYCEKCCRIVEDDRCPFCRNRKLRQPEPGDLCLLTEEDYVSSTILEDVLKQNGIPFLKKGVLGAGLAIKVGPMLERSRFYVAYEHLAGAAAVAEDLFSAAEEIGADGQDEQEADT